MRMNAADTSASSAIADWTLVTVVSRSSTTAEMDTFISDVSTTRMNMAIASRMASRLFSGGSVGVGSACSVIAGRPASAACRESDRRAWSSPGYRSVQPLPRSPRLTLRRPHAHIYLGY